MVSFSIIVPTKDRKSLLDDAIASVIRQSYPNWELLIVNDSKSGSNVLIPDDKRIRLIQNDGSGRNAARNTGIRKAKFDHICFLDDDDLFEVDFLLEFDKFYKNNSLKDIPRQGFSYLYKGGKTKRGTLYNFKKYKDQAFYLANNMVGLYTFCFPKFVFDKVKLDERFYLWEDTHFLLRVSNHFSFIQINKYGYLYRIHANMGSRKDMTSGMIKQSLHDNLKPIDDYFNNHNLSFPESFRDRLIAQKLLEYAVADLVYGRGLNAKKWLKASLKNKIRFEFFKSYIYFTYYYVKKAIKG